MDQVQLTDFYGTLGIGNFRYALVIAALHDDGDYWDFINLKGLGAEEAHMAFKQFAKQAGTSFATVMVYCDSHESLIRVCKDFKVLHKHPPPGISRANAVIERKIGVALAGLRAMLVTGCLPNCFWPFVGHVFAFHSCLKNGSFARVTGGIENFATFVPCQLVFFKPAKTIAVTAKTDNPLIPGIFLDQMGSSQNKFLA